MREVKYCEKRVESTEVNDSLLKTVVLGVGLGRGLCVETADLDEGGRLLSIRSTNIFEMFAESVRVIENSVTNTHTTGKDALPVVHKSERECQTFMGAFRLLFMASRVGTLDSQKELII